MAKRNRLLASGNLQLQEIEPLTKNQLKAFESDKHLVLHGVAGTGKTFISCYLAFDDILKNEFSSLVIIRSAVPTRDIGFLPGNEEEKKDAYTGPYRSAFTELFEDPEAWEKLKNSHKVEFLSTSFIRGMTLQNSVVIIDEMQNLNFHELDSVITRIGQNCKFIMCGDYYQSDFDKERDKNGILKFLEIIEQLRNFEVIEFTWEDIVRSDFVRDYIMTKEMLEKDGKI